MTGNLGGIAGADGHCYRHAVRSGVKGEFRAVLTSRLQDIESIVHTNYRDLPVTNSKVNMSNRFSLTSHWKEINRHVLR